MAGVGQRQDANVPSFTVSVGTSSTVVLNNSPAALERVIVNDGANTVYLNLGSGAAVVGKGIRLNANGGAWSSETYKGPVTAIAAVAASSLCGAEV